MADKKPVKPYDTQHLTKKQEVAMMFDNISPKYDFLNHSLSFGIDQLWRKKLIKMLKKQQPATVLDIATGTADLALMEAKVAEQVTGVDISEGMLAVGRTKVAKRGLADKIKLEYGDSENLPYTDNSFDAITASFGVRNFEDLEKGFSEMLRVLKPGGKVYVLEFSQPRRFPVKQLYFFYFTNVLPLWGRLISKDSSAYTYLPESVKAFPDGENLTAVLKKCGFIETKYKFLSFGIAAIYTGEKPAKTV